jgi:hypothetical protein
MKVYSPRQLRCPSSFAPAGDIVRPAMSVISLQAIVREEEIVSFNVVLARFLCASDHVPLLLFAERQLLLISSFLIFPNLVAWRGPARNLSLSRTCRYQETNVPRVVT